MTTFAGGCSVSVTITPTPGVAGVFVAGATVSFQVTPTPGGPRLPAYTDADGATQTIFIEEWYKGRTVEQDGVDLKYSRVFFIRGTYQTSDCLDIGPQVGDADDILPSFIVQSRKLEWYAQGGGASNIVRLAVDLQQPSKPQSEGGDTQATYTYDFSSESEHVDVAFIQANYPADSLQDGENLLINYDGVQTVEGVEIESPILEITEEHNFTEAQFSPAFRRLLRDNIATVNSDTFRDFAPGEVFFAGASASKGYKKWVVTFRFRVRRGFKNRDFTITNKAGAQETQTVTKFGWDYLWVSMGKRPDSTNTKLQVAPASIHVANVYTFIDFAVLGIGVEPLN